MYKFYPKIFVQPPFSGRTKKILLIMKLTTLLLITAILQVSASTFAQKITLSEKNAPLIKVFDDISSQTGYDFLVSTSMLKSANTVSIDVKNMELRDVLNQIFSDEPLNYEVQNKSVVVSQKEPSLLDNLKNKIKAELTQTTVTGKVVDGTGQPIPGVNVREKGTQNGTVTDSKGAYSLTVADARSIITFSYIGYETQELAAKDLPNGSTITLKPQENNLREVVISKGYYNEKLVLSTSDIGVVSSKEIEEQPVSDPIQALEGRVAGLDIQQSSGIPGANATIRIRGLNSIANGNDPYYVIDGVPFTATSLTSGRIGGGALNNANGSSQGAGLSPFNVLNLDDIEDIEVLKDADATAIYGSKGANGVILITTKKGKAGETKVNFDVSQGISQVGHFMDLLNTPQYLQMMRQAYSNDGLGVPNHYDIDGVWDTTRYTNWQKVLIGNTAQFTNMQGSISGGNANTQFLIGGGYTRQTTVYLGDGGYGDKKGSLHFSLTHNSSNQKFKVLLSASYGSENNDVPQNDFANLITMAPDAPALYNKDGSLNWEFYQGNSTWNNPVANTVISYSSVVNNLSSNLNLSYQIIPGLILQSSFGYNHNQMNQVQLTPATVYPPPYNNFALGRYNEFANNLGQGWIIEPQLNYRKEIGKGELNVLLGGTLEENTLQSFAEEAYGFSSDELISDPLAAAYTKLLADGYSQDRYEALLARVGYIWEDKYILNLTANRDGSSRFGPGKQFGNFGSVGAGWIFSKEKSIQDALPWLSFGKLRASYGITGSDQIGDYQYLSTYNPSSTSYQGVTILTPNGVTNPYFAWEVDKKLEGGVDIGLLKDRINLSVSYYRNRTGNQLVGEPLPSTTGFTGVTYNLPAVVQNTGLEVNLSSSNVKTKDFSWTTRVNFTLPNNKLVSYPGLAESNVAGSVVVGKSLFTRQLYQYTGINPQTGLYTFAMEDANGNIPYPQGLVTSAPITQKYYGGIGNNFSYKGFQLDIFFQFVKQLGYSYIYAFEQPGSDNFNQPTAALSVWQNPGQTAIDQKLGYNSAYQSYTNFQQSTGVLTDASFIRLKNVALSYKLPSGWQSWAHMSNGRFYLQGQNLYTFTKYIGLDPETQGLGLPPLRTIVMGVSASF